MGRSYATFTVDQPPTTRFFQCNMYMPTLQPAVPKNSKFYILLLIQAEYIGCTSRITYMMNFPLLHSVSQHQAFDAPFLRFRKTSWGLWDMAPFRIQVPKRIQKTYVFTLHHAWKSYLSLQTSQKTRNFPTWIELSKWMNSIKPSNWMWGHFGNIS